MDEIDIRQEEEVVSWMEMRLGGMERRLVYNDGFEREIVESGKQESDLCFFQCTGGEEMRGQGKVEYFNRKEIEVDGMVEERKDDEGVMKRRFDYGNISGIQVGVMGSINEDGCGLALGDEYMAGFFTTVPMLLFSKLRSLGKSRVELKTVMKDGKDEKEQVKEKMEEDRKKNEVTTAAVSEEVEVNGEEVQFVLEGVRDKENEGLEWSEEVDILDRLS